MKDDQTLAVAEYSYDALSRRVQKVDKAANPDVTYDYYYGQKPLDGSSWQVLETYKNIDSDVYERFIWGGQHIDEIIRRQRDTDTDGSFDDTLYYLQDGNWNVTALLNTDGAVQERYLYDAYGMPTVLDGSWSSQDAGTYANEILYAGCYYDVGTENYYVRSRYLNPALGRWLQRDPLGYLDGMSLYEHRGSNPTRLGDGPGLWSDTSAWYDLYQKNGISSKHPGFSYQLDKIVRYRPRFEDIEQSWPNIPWLTQGEHEVLGQ